MENYNNSIQAELPVSQDPSGLWIWVTLPNKELQPAEVFSDGKGNMG